MRQQFLKFVTIGVVTTIVNYTIFYILYSFLSVYYVISSAVGFMTGVLMSYRLNKRWTFNIQTKSFVYVYKYYFVYACSLILSLFFLDYLVRILEIIPEIANILTIGLSTCTNFAGTKFWVFKK